MVTKIEKDAISGTPTTGHEWDGIKELNTPLPRWWIYTFYGCIVWAIGYTIAYPAWPLISGATPGLLGYSSRGQLEQSLTEAKTAQKVNLDKIAAADVNAILKDDSLREFARAGGAAAFKVNCVPCHGSGAAGAVGYPNLNDNDWLWGGTPDAIYTTLKNGIRYTQNPDTRVMDMQVFGPDPANDGAAVLAPEQIDQVSNYVVSLSDAGAADAAKATAGKQIYTDNCAACHGDNAQGNKDMGAPNLSDKIWLYGGSVRAVAAQVTKPRMSVMPAWSHRLDDATIKQLAVYVHTLGGGEAAAQ